MIIDHIHARLLNHKDSLNFGIVKGCLLIKVPHAREDIAIA